MKKDNVNGLRLGKILIIFGTAIGLLAWASPQVVFASISDDDGASVSNSSNPNQEAIDHINQAQSALQNGDTEGASMHMDAAKQTLGCDYSPYIPNC